MDKLTVVLLALMIFGPAIEIRDKNERLRFEYQGIVFGFIKYLYWTINSFRKNRKEN